MRMQLIERRKQKLIEEKRKQNAKASMQQARDLACSILELSSSDLDNFLIEEEQEEVCSSFFFCGNIPAKVIFLQKLRSPATSHHPLSESSDLYIYNH